MREFHNSFHELKNNILNKEDIKPKIDFNKSSE